MALEEPSEDEPERDPSLLTACALQSPAPLPFYHKAWDQVLEMAWLAELPLQVTELTVPAAVPGNPFEHFCNLGRLRHALAIIELGLKVKQWYGLVCPSDVDLVRSSLQGLEGCSKEREPDATGFQLCMLQSRCCIVTQMESSSL